MPNRDIKKENKELRNLININKDASEFYESAQEKAKNPQIRQTFANLENLHNGVKANIQTLVLSNAGDAEAEETFVGQTKQFWGELVTAVSNDVDTTLVKHLEEAEDRCLSAIKDAMSSDNISPMTKSALRRSLQRYKKVMIT